MPFPDTSFLRSCLWVALTAMLSVTAHAVEAAHSPRWSLAEPVLSDSITDIDAPEEGEVEVDLTGSFARGVPGTAASWESVAEVEWRALRWLGLSLEGAVGAQRHELTFDTPQFAGLQAGLAFSFLRDDRRELYLQAELSGRFLAQVDLPFEPGEPSLPYSLLLRVGKRWGHGTLRGALGAALDDPRTPAGRGVYVEAAWLMELNRFGAFYGIEGTVDWTLHPVTTLAPEVEMGVELGHVPIRFAVAVPWVYDPGEGRSWFGGFLRLIGELDSERED